jgi:photosystem II P680 reaction center D1 protein
MHGSLVTSSLIRETAEGESTNYGYKFGQEEETYNIVAAHGFGRLIFQYASFNNSFFTLLLSCLASCRNLVNCFRYFNYIQLKWFQLQPIYR